MESADQQAEKGVGFMRFSGPSATETLVLPRRDECPHQTNRGRNTIYFLPGQEVYVVWTR